MQLTDIAVTVDQVEARSRGHATFILIVRAVIIALAIIGVIALANMVETSQDTNPHVIKIGKLNA